jgi:hypothetical protein
MYISGTQFNFEERLHSLFTDYGSLVTGKIEASGYIKTNNVNYFNFIDWNTEFFRKMKQSTNTGVLMFSTGQYTYISGKVSGLF